MINEELINEAVRNSINAITGINGFAIKSHQDGPRPLGQYATVHNVSHVEIGYPEEVKSSNEDGTLDITMTDHVEVMMSINVYGGDAITQCSTIRQAMARSTIRSMLHAAGLSVMERSNVRDLKEVIKGSWESRAQFDITLSATAVDIYTEGSMQSAEIQAEVQNPSQTFNTIIGVTPDV